MKVIFLLPAFVFHGSIVVSLTCTAYHWGTFMEAEIQAGILGGQETRRKDITLLIAFTFLINFINLKI
jgi:hypothetical protein